MRKEIEIRCEICDKSFCKHDYEQHVLSKNHIQNCTHHNSVIINDMPPFISICDLIKFLSDYGEIEKYTVINNKKDMKLHFKNHKPVEILLSESVYINGVKLNICKVFANKHAGKHKKQKNRGTKNNAKKVVDIKMFFQDQLASFLDQVSLSEREISQYYEPVCAELDRIFQGIFPKAKTYAFGSTVSGLGFKNCDLDLYLNIGLPVIDDQNDKVIGPHVITASAIFSLAEKTLRLNRQKFTKLVPIPSAKIPIIKFIYQPTNVQCDLSFHNSLAVYNSKLVKYYLSLDPRLRPFAMIIRYWIANRSDIHVTKYAITMLIIFYFQQLKMIPTVIELQQKCAVPIKVNGWQVNFYRETKFHIKNNEKNSSIPSLLQRFFAFYANYDFKTNVLCPFDGKSYSKDLFFEPETLPASMNSYKEYLKTPNAKVISIWRPMCLQDPQELCQNLTHNIIDIQLNKFQEYCATASKIVQCSSHNQYQDLLPSIFNLNKYKKSVIPKPMTFTYDLCPNNFIIEKSVLFIKNEQKNDLFIKNNWFDLTLSIFRQYLDQVLNFNVEIVNRESNALVLHCTGTDCLWANRKVLRFESDNLLMPIKKEIEVTKILLKKMKLNDISSNVSVKIECCFEKKTEPNLYIRWTLKDRGCSEKVFDALAQHLLGKLPNLIKKTFNVIRQMKNLNHNDDIYTKIFS